MAATSSAHLARYRTASALIGNALTVLEVGCGDGIGAGILAKGRETYHGIDPDGAAIAVASEQPLHGCRFYASDAFALPCFAERYQAVVALNVIEQIPARWDGRLFDALKHSLAPDGVCVVGTPNAADRLRTVMHEHFSVVQELGLPDDQHYLMTVGIGPRREDGSD